MSFLRKEVNIFFTVLFYLLLLLFHQLPLHFEEVKLLLSLFETFFPIVSKLVQQKSHCVIDTLFRPRIIVSSK